MVVAKSYFFGAKLEYLMRVKRLLHVGSSVHCSALGKSRQNFGDFFTAAAVLRLTGSAAENDCSVVGDGTAYGPSIGKHGQSRTNKQISVI